MKKSFAIAKRSQRLIALGWSFIFYNSSVLAQVESTDNTLQITEVNRLEDVQPNDWAFEALRSLLEAVYRFPLNENIQITPLVQVIFDPANQNSNGTIVTGTLRTVFFF